jgi:hypothetical protein
LIEHGNKISTPDFYSSIDRASLFDLDGASHDAAAGGNQAMLLIGEDEV